MASALGIANRALYILGEPKITAFTDSGVAAGTVSDLFADAFYEAQSEDTWYFLSTRALIVNHAQAWASSTAYSPGYGADHNDIYYNALLSSTGVEPGVHASSTSYWEEEEQEVYADYTGYWYKYDLPSDLYRPVSMEPDYVYIIENDHLYTDYTPDATNYYPRLKYQVDVITSSATGPAISTTYADRIPSWFERVVAARLAMDSAIKITGKKSEYERCREEYFVALNKAMGHNATHTPSPDQEDDSWVNP